MPPRPVKKKVVARTPVKTEPELEVVHEARTTASDPVELKAGDSLPDLNRASAVADDAEASEASAENGSEASIEEGEEAVKTEAKLSDEEARGHGHEAGDGEEAAEGNESADDGEGDEAVDGEGEEYDGDGEAEEGAEDEDQHEGSVDDGEDVEVPAPAKERRKQKEFEVLVGGLDNDAVEDDSKKLLGEVGEVVEARPAKNPHTQKNKGFAFIRLATVDRAKNSVKDLKNPQVRGKQCGVSRTQDNETLYVCNICRTWTKDALRNKLKEYGVENVEELTLMDDPQSKGMNRGFAFLEFNTHLDATHAFKRLQKRDVFFGVDVSAKVAFAKSGIEPDEEVMAQDDTSISWRKRKKHFFILSNSGKPIYTRHGDEHKLAGFSATLQAIISFVENGGDCIRLVRAGNHQVIFLVKGPIYLVCISSTEEPYQALKGQLELLYGQMLLILTQSIDKCFEKNSKFDMTPLLGGTDVVFSSLIHAFSWNPATFLHAYTCLPLPYSTRQSAGAILQDVADSGVLFAILMCGHKVVSLVGAQKATLHPDDMLLLSNFVSSSESFRTSESFSPICLPQYNPMAFLYAYVHYLEVDTYLMLLTTNSDAFFHLKECRIRIETVLVKSNVLSEVQRSMLEGGLRVENLPGDPTLRSESVSFRSEQDKINEVADSTTGAKSSSTGIGGPAGLWNFMYRSIYLDQYVASEFSPPIHSRNAQKRLFRAYQKLYASMHDKDTGPHKMQFRRDENYVLLCWITQDFELYAAFDPLAEKSSAITVCNRVCQWLRDVESEIFLLGASPFSW